MSRLRLFLYIFAFLVLAGDFLVSRGHAGFAWESIPGFSAFFGFASCMAISAVAWMLDKILGRKERNYE